ncbi:hypothetical protein [Streptomyces sp. NPDC048603]|uniref:hypothetical protein n=1 Tax=Streptomyces sp. NPDC048603 TaxID=3365577 RepID=UPI0037221774
MKPSRIFRTGAAVGLLTTALLAGTATTASAKTGEEWITASAQCQAVQKVILQSGHEYMAVNPKVNSGGCLCALWSRRTNSYV